MAAMKKKLFLAFLFFVWIFFSLWILTLQSKRKILYEKNLYYLATSFFLCTKFCLKLTRKIIRTWCTTRRKLNRFLMWNKTGWELEVWKQFLLQRFFNFLCGSLFQCGGSRWFFRTLPYFQCERIYVCWGRNDENIQPWEINFPMKNFLFQSFVYVHDDCLRVFEKGTFVGREFHCELEGKIFSMEIYMCFIHSSYY